MGKKFRVVWASKPQDDPTFCNDDYEASKMVGSFDDCVAVLMDWMKTKEKDGFTVDFIGKGHLKATKVSPTSTIHQHCFVEEGHLLRLGK